MSNQPGLSPAAGALGGLVVGLLAGIKGVGEMEIDTK